MGDRQREEGIGGRGRREERDREEEVSFCIHLVHPIPPFPIVCPILHLVCPSTPLFVFPLPLPSPFVLLRFNRFCVLALP